MTKEKLKEEIFKVSEEGNGILKTLEIEEKGDAFRKEYQKWYTKTLKIVEILAKDRHVEFKGYYDIDLKRKEFSLITFVIQDFINGIRPGNVSIQDAKLRVKRSMFNQLTILDSLVGRIDNVLSNIEGELYIEIQDAELSTAKELLKISPRAAGALTGVVIETYLQKVIKNRGLSINKKHPTISDMNDPLKIGEIIDIPTWRKISYLSDLRNLCSHKKDSEPTKEQVIELIDGANWLIKNVF